MSRSSHRGRGGQGGFEPRTRIRTRERRALELVTLGWSQHQIAADLAVSQSAVSKLLTRVEQRVLRELMDTVERQKVRQNLRLEHQYAEAMRAWDASKADTRRKRQRKTQGGSGRGASTTIAEVVTEDQHGDPRYLELARRVLADLRKLWGLEMVPPLDVRLRDPYDDLTEEAIHEELQRLRRLQDATAEVAAPGTGIAGDGVVTGSAQPTEGDHVVE